MFEGWRSLTAWWRQRRSRADMEEELRTHLEMDTEEAIDRGADRQAATRQARLRLGSNSSVLERMRDQEMATLIEGVWQDVVFGLRAVRKTPVFSLTAVLTLAIGIGANTTIFTLLYGLLFERLPVPHVGELANVAVETGDPDDHWYSGAPYLMMQQFAREQHSFRELSFWDEASVSIRDKEGALRQYNAGLVSGNGFSVLGMRPRLGRWLQPSDDVRGGPVGGWGVVLSYGFWNDRFRADPDILGRQLEMSGAQVTVVGVAPRGFRGMYRGFDTKVYLPLHFSTVIFGKNLLDDRDSFYFVSPIGRLNPGVTRQQAAAEAKHVAAQRLFRQFVPLEAQRTPEFQRAVLTVHSGSSGFASGDGLKYREPLYILQGLVGAVLLLCCINVGGLMTARVYTRKREFAVRSAIGAGRFRLIRQYLTESLVIGLAGAALGAAAAWYSAPALLHFFRDPMMFEAVSVQPDGTVLWISAAAAIITTLLCGTLPALRAGRTDGNTLLATRSGLSIRRSVAGRTFVPLQVGLSLVLVATASLLSQSFVALRNQPTGFEVNHVTIQTPPLTRIASEGDAKLDLYQRMVDRIGQMPGVRSVAVTFYTPLTGSQATGQFEPLRDKLKGLVDHTLAYNLVGPGYFRTMAVHVLRGREFLRQERKQDICVVNEAAANRLFPHEEALGGYVRNHVNEYMGHEGVCRVIGIVQDARYASLRDPAPPTIYYPLASDSNRVGNLVFLMNANTTAEAIAGYRKALMEIAPSVPLVLFVTLREQLDAALGSQRLITFLSDLFALVAVLLTAIGLYGLLSASVAQRTSEIGLRIALGARRARLLRTVMSEAAALLVLGLIVGSAGVLFAVRAVEKMLFGVSAWQSVALLLGSVLLLVLAMLVAAAPPAVRAVSVDPIAALRTE